MFKTIITGAIFLFFANVLFAQSTIIKRDIIRDIVDTVEKRECGKCTIKLVVDYSKNDLKRYGDIAGWTIALDTIIPTDTSLYNSLGSAFSKTNISISDFGEFDHRDWVLSSQTDTGKTIIIYKPIYLNWGPLDILDALINSGDNKSEWVSHNQNYLSCVLDIPVVYVYNNPKWSKINRSVFLYKIYSDEDVTKVNYRFINALGQ